MTLVRASWQSGLLFPIWTTRLVWCASQGVLRMEDGFVVVRFFLFLLFPSLLSSFNFVSCAGDVLLPVGLQCITRTVSRIFFC